MKALWQSLNELSHTFEFDSPKARLCSEAAQRLQEIETAQSREKDAARYRFWRLHHRGIWVSVVRENGFSLVFDAVKSSHYPISDTPENVDAAIDEAMNRACSAATADLAQISKE